MLAQPRPHDCADRGGVAILHRPPRMGRPRGRGRPADHGSRRSRPQVRYRVDLPDARAARPSRPTASVSVWLDSQPLWAEVRDARRTRAIRRDPTADGTLAFALDAPAQSDGAAAPHRLARNRTCPRTAGHRSPTPMLQASADRPASADRALSSRWSFPLPPLAPGAAPWSPARRSPRGAPALRAVRPAAPPLLPARPRSNSACARTGGAPATRPQSSSKALIAEGEPARGCRGGRLPTSSLSSPPTISSAHAPPAPRCPSSPSPRPPRARSGWRWLLDHYLFIRVPARPPCRVPGADVAVRVAADLVARQGSRLLLGARADRASCIIRRPVRQLHAAHFRRRSVSSARPVRVRRVRCSS